jgi:hypothetical protein
MVAVALCTAVVGGFSISTGPAWHHAFSGADAAYGFRGEIGISMLEGSGTGMDWLLTAQGMTTTMDNGDEEFPATFRKYLGSIGYGLRLYRGPAALQLGIGPAMAHDCFLPGGRAGYCADEGGVALSATASLRIWRFLRIEVAFTDWILPDVAGDSILSAGLSAEF